MGRAASSAPCGSTPHTRPHPTTATYTSCCGPERFRLSTPNRQVAGSSPARSTPCSGSSVVEQFRAVTTTTAAASPSPRAGVGRLSAERPARAGRSAGSSRARRLGFVAQSLRLASTTAAHTKGGTRCPTCCSTRRASCLDAGAAGVRVDECTLLNRPGFDGGAYVRVFVEDTSIGACAARLRRRGSSCGSPTARTRSTSSSRRHAELARELALQDRHPARRAPALPRRPRCRGGAASARARARAATNDRKEVRDVAT